MTIRRHTLLALAAIALATGCGPVEADLAEPAEAPSASDSATELPEDPETEPVVQQTPEPSDFKLSIRILEKKCFGSAGCNITYRINPAYTGPSLADDQELTVTYKVTGGDDPQINSFEMVGTEASFDSKEFISTPSSGSKLKATVTDVF